MLVKKIATIKLSDIPCRCVAIFCPAGSSLPANFILTNTALQKIICANFYVMRSFSLAIW
jgi:hypothetical protein